MVGKIITPCDLDPSLTLTKPRVPCHHGWAENWADGPLQPICFSYLTG